MQKQKMKGYDVSRTVTLSGLNARINDEGKVEIDFPLRSLTNETLDAVGRTVRGAGNLDPMMQNILHDKIIGQIEDAQIIYQIMKEMK